MPVWRLIFTPTTPHEGHTVCTASEQCIRDVHATTLYARRDSWVGASVCTTDFSLYDRLLERRAEAEALLGAAGGEVVWNDGNEKSRELLVRLAADVLPEHWDELYPWIADALLRIRRLVGELE